MEGQGGLEPGSLRKLLRASRTWDATSRKEMRAGLRAAASQGAEKAKFTVLGPPPGSGIRTGPSTGLRRGLASGVSVSIRSGREVGGTVKGEGVRITTSSTKLPADKAPMVKAYMADTFRHPVFGRRDTYVSQRGKDWFYKPLFEGRQAYQRAIVDAIEAAAEAIAKD